MAINTFHTAIKSLRSIEGWKVAAENPFAGHELSRNSSGTPAATADDLIRFIASADSLGYPSLGTAALVTWELCCRVEDVIGNFKMSDYRPHDLPDGIRIRHNKTDDPFVRMLIYRGQPVFPLLVQRLDAAKAAFPDGPLIRREIKARNGTHSWGGSIGISATAYKIINQIKEAANIKEEVTLTGFRHGSITEMAEAGLTEAQLMAHTRHTDPRTLYRYIKNSPTLFMEGQKKRMQYVKERDG